MAVAKKAKAIPAKSKGAKASNNKKSTSKPAPKPVAKKTPAPVPKKSAPVKGKTPPAKPAPAVKAKSSPTPTKTAAKNTVSKPVAKPEPVKKTEKEKAKPEVASKAEKPKNAPVKAAPAKPEAKPQSAVSKAKPAKPEPASKKTESKKPAAAPAKEEKGKGKGDKLKMAPKPSSDEFQELDPADAKAKKIMKELEETMDLAAMKPRIKVPTPTKTITTRHLHHPPLRLIEPTNTNKQKYSLEFEFRSSPKILFNALSDSSGLAGWFADEVRTKDDQFTFVWEGGESYARLVALKDMHLVRFQWNEDTDGTYFQFEIKQDELTGEIALVITDFALPGEKDTNMRLWESQVQNLRMLLGSL